MSSIIEELSVQNLIKMQGILTKNERALTYPELPSWGLMKLSLPICQKETPCYI